MQAHEAHITVRSEPGKGTEFTLLFRQPAAEAPGDFPASRPVELSPVRGSARGDESR